MVRKVQKKIILEFLINQFGNCLWLLLFLFVVRTELVHADECCMKIILLVITGNFLSGSFRFVGALKSICSCIPSGFAAMSLSTVSLKTLQQFPVLHGNFWQRFLYRREAVLSLAALTWFFCPVNVHRRTVRASPKRRELSWPWVREDVGTGRCLGDEEEGRGPARFAFSPLPEINCHFLVILNVVW